MKLSRLNHLVLGLRTGSTCAAQTPQISGFQMEVYLTGAKAMRVCTAYLKRTTSKLME